MTANSLSDAIASHIAGTSCESLPAATIHATRRAILDGVGVMLAASGLSDEAKPFISLAIRQAGTGEARILGHRQRVSAPLAALANGALAHALDYEDAFDAAPVHANASLLPAALAIADAHGPVSGREFIAAVAIGCDLVCRLALALRQPMEQGGWYPPPILGAFGAVAAAARLLRLDARQTRDALSLMLCQATCPGEIKYSPDTVIRAVREAFPAQAAVLSALLAGDGVRGFEQPLEGRSGFYALYANGHFDLDTLLRDLGRSYWIEQLSFKPWPCCRGTHAYIEAAQTLRSRHGIVPDDILAMEFVGGETQRMLIEPLPRKCAPQTLIDAKFSLPFSVALALTQDEVRLASFTQHSLRDSAVLALASRSSWELHPGWNQGHATAGALSLKLRDGRRVSHQVDEARGHPSRPLDDAALLAKFVDCAQRAAVPLSVADAEGLAGRILQIDQATDTALALTV